MRMSNKLFREAERRAVKEVECRLKPVLTEFGLLSLSVIERKQLFQFCFDGEGELDRSVLRIPVVVEVKREATDRILGRRLGPEDLIDLGKRVSQLSFTLVVEGALRQGDIIYLASELKKSESAGGGDATRQRIMRGIAGLY